MPRVSISQSRNFYFQPCGSGSTACPIILFQSRNRETSIFNEKAAEPVLALIAVSISQSRNFYFQRQRRTPAGMHGRIQFQSRNRETSIFNSKGDDTMEQLTMFQSRNRETSIFNFNKDDPKYLLASGYVSISQSRNFYFQLHPDTWHGPAEFPRVSISQSRNFYFQLSRCMNWWKTEHCFNLAIEKLLFSTVDRCDETQLIFSFNLAIEKLLFSTRVILTGSWHRSEFQSRNRETSIFNYAGRVDRGADQWFQSRNRETSIFNRRVATRQRLGSAFQSRNRETSIFN